MKVSTWAGIEHRQAELDFVDIDTLRDLPLFVDPYAIDIRNDAWSAKCSRYLRSYFTALITALRNGEEGRATHLASHLHETNETFLGLSKGAPQGRGIGRDQAGQLIEALRRSQAVKTGLLTELAETELFIEGIGADKVSDLTTNILRGPLLEYTEQQATLWGMPLTDGLAFNPVWDPTKEDWGQAHRRSIVVAGSPVILVPKFSVRRALTLNSQEFYNHYMVTHLQQEYNNAAQGLARMLRGQQVTKRDVKERHPKSKPALAAFAEQHPAVLAQYKRLAGAKGVLECDEIDPDFNEGEYARLLAQELRNIAPGGDSASAYHDFCIGALTFIFYPQLIAPVKEKEIDQGRKRIDVSYTNAAREGFFDTALRSPQLRTIELPVECKNYSQDVANPELDQLTGRFSHVRGFLGLLCCRSFDDKPRFIARCKDSAVHRGHYVIALDDADLAVLLLNIELGNRDGNDQFMRRRHAEIIA